MNRAVALRTIGMHAYAGAMTARGVLAGARGHHALFGRTPKRGSGLDADDGVDVWREVGTRVDHNHDRAGLDDPGVGAWPGVRPRVRRQDAMDGGQRRTAGR